jgi:hypothetical protein
LLGVGADGMAGEKNLHDADFTISLFRFCQLLCEGHNLEFQNYLRSQPGSNTNVNIIICTVDYLLSLQVISSFIGVFLILIFEILGIINGFLLALFRKRNS